MGSEDKPERILFVVHAWQADAIYKLLQKHLGGKKPTAVNMGKALFNVLLENECFGTQDHTAADDRTLELPTTWEDLGIEDPGSPGESDEDS